MLEWLDRRLFIRDLFTRPVIPRGKASWQYFPTFLTFALLFFQLFSGMYLAFHYIPGTEVAKTGMLRYLYNCHYIGAQVLIVAVFLYFLRNLLTGTYQAPREIHWLTIIVLSFLIWLNYFLGSLLPNNPAAHKTALIAIHLLRQVPWMGSRVIHWLHLEGGLSQISTHRLYVLHSFVVPTMIYMLVFFYLWLLTKSGIASEEKTSA